MDTKKRSLDIGSSTTGYVMAKALIPFSLSFSDRWSAILLPPTIIGTTAELELRPKLKVLI